METLDKIEKLKGLLEWGAIAQGEFERMKRRFSIRARPNEGRAESTRPFLNMGKDRLYRSLRPTHLYWISVPWRASRYLVEFFLFEEPQPQNGRDHEVYAQYYQPFGHRRVVGCD